MELTNLGLPGKCLLNVDDAKVNTVSIATA